MRGAGASNGGGNQNIRESGYQGSRQTTEDGGQKTVSVSGEQGKQGIRRLAN